MINQWLKKDVNLNLLAERIRPFFSEPDFHTALEESQNGYVIEAVSKIPNLNLEIEVQVIGQPNDFTVEFFAGGRSGFSPSMILGQLTSMLGGGYLIRRGAQRRETLDALERSFWKHVQMQVADLANSATTTKRLYKESAT